ncbi:unnamed protein product [Dovyalis caffra]|uniref:ACB domain-containing protein n=1 Tax=Dovyalis caffra TaxID=77055 RepID=A0AAV1RVF5_9ROSI|nr:unnamed protein product [Dovyalis caffra]
MAMARASSGLAYPERFYAASAYAGFDGSNNSTNTVSSKFQNDTALLLYALYQQATVGPCNVPKPSSWKAVEQSKWKSTRFCELGANDVKKLEMKLGDIEFLNSFRLALWMYPPPCSFVEGWQGLGNMASAEAMRLFVKILEEDDPSWYSRASNSISESFTDTQVNWKENDDATDNYPSEVTFQLLSLSTTTYLYPSHPAPYSISTALLPQCHRVPQASPTPPLNNFQIAQLMPLLHSLKRMLVYAFLACMCMCEMHYSKDEPAIENGNSFPQTKTISTENGTHVETQDKDVVSEDVGTVAVYDQWIAPPITGQPPKARYEVLDLRSWAWSKVIFKVENESQEAQSPAKLTPCAGHSLIPWENKLLSIAGHTKDPSETIQVRVFDLQSCTWSTLKTYGKAPVSRGGQSVTRVGTSLVIFGGQDAKRSLLNDLHILDLETMTWDEIDAIGVPPSPRSDHAAAVHAEHGMDKTYTTGEIPTPRAGHAGVTVGENWFIVGGGDNKSGVSETAVLNMSTLVWSVVTSVQGRVPLASEGLSLVLSAYNGEDILVSFGGYNGRYSNEVNVLKPSHKSTLQSKIAETPVPDSVSAIHNVTNPIRDVESEFEVGQEGKIREIVMDNVDLESRVWQIAKWVPFLCYIVFSGTLNILNSMQKSRGEGTSEHLLATLKAEREELDFSLSKEKLQTLQLNQDLADAEARNTDLYKELQSVRGQLAAEQSRCFKLEVDVAELRQKLQTMETLQKELELLQRQKAASEHALNANHRQGSGGVWGWLAGTPGGQKGDEA